jgi:riboflavin kinase
MAEEHPIHLPDLKFVQYCNRNFRINRGIYNTIDEYFYNEGMLNITRRRRKIIGFLTYLRHTNSIKSNGKINIGNCGLSSKLHAFSNQCPQSTQRILTNRRERQIYAKPKE